MNLLILGKGKTGSLVAEIARERRHHVSIAASADNESCAALTPDRLHGIDAVIDFTTPQTAVPHIEACVRASKCIVVGTTGWYGELPRVEELASKAQSGVLYGANFSVGVNLFYAAVQTAAEALRYGYSGQIFERHHKHKKDAPSGTAAKMQHIVRRTSGVEVEITSFREGEVVGMHEFILNSGSDRIYLCHDASSRRGFAEGAVRGAEWLTGKHGLFDFQDVWREL